MKYIVYILSLLLFLVLLGLVFINPDKLNKEKPEVFLWYDLPPDNYSEGLPVSTDDLFGMVHGNIIQEKITITDKSIYKGTNINQKVDFSQALMNKVKYYMYDKSYSGKGRDKEKRRLDSAYLLNERYSISSLIIDFPDHQICTDYKREFNVDSALVKISYDISGVKFKREIFGVRSQNAIVLKITADRPGEINCRIWFDNILPCIENYIDDNGRIIMKGNTNIETDKGMGMSTGSPIIWISRAKISNKGGCWSEEYLRDKTDGYRAVKIERADEVVIVMDINFNGESKKLPEKSFKAFKKEHINECSEYNKSDRVFRRHLNKEKGIIGILKN